MDRDERHAATTHNHSCGNVWSLPAQTDSNAGSDHPVAQEAQRQT